MERRAGEVIQPIISSGHDFHDIPLPIDKAVDNLVQALLVLGILIAVKVVSLFLQTKGNQARNWIEYRWMKFCSYVSVRSSISSFIVLLVEVPRRQLDNKQRSFIYPGTFCDDPSVMKLHDLFHNRQAQT